jgi:formylglycine-generating enzyme
MNYPTSKPRGRHAPLVIVAVALLAACGPKKLDDCIQLVELQTDEVAPAGVRTVFQATACNGDPIADLTDDNIRLLLDGEELQSEGTTTSVLTQEVEFELFTLVLLDMSDSIVQNQNLGPMISAARKLVGRLLADGHRVAIYQFAGPSYFGAVQDFTTDDDLLDEALDQLASSDGMGTTDLYGSLIKALQDLEAASDPDVLHTNSLVLFTDGTDEAMASTKSQAEAAVESTEANVFTVGLGGDVDKEELIDLGKDGFEWAENHNELEEAFAKITEHIKQIAQSYYLIGVCSPRVGGWHEMQIRVIRDNERGKLTVYYDADGFDVKGCDPDRVAQPCLGRECGYVDGFACGECDDGEWCNDSYQCEDACADAECGYAHGVDCGDCSDYGETWLCDESNTCVDACADAECGYVLGMDCGDCSDYGETWLCDDHACVDACEDMECGNSMGIDCGDCSEYGEDWGCDETGTCVDACAEIECGEYLGIDCGGCSEHGESWACDESNTCVDACASVECGESMGIDCGDCSEYGWNYGCDETGTCVDACAEAECGWVLGVNCGECENGFTCNSDNVCEPFALPGMSWFQISGGNFTLGCDYGLDSSCDYDEQRHEVLLSDFWIMDTEVTVAMYEQCVEDNACNPAHVDTGGECNYGVSGREDHPINCIEWEGLQEFCEYTGGSLPTESQWERAYRGDHDGASASYWIYPWGNSPLPSCSKAVMNDGGAGCGLGHTDEVGTKPATSFGLLNTSGNVSEWVVDWYGEELGDCGVEDCTDPDGPATGVDRVVRGGNWTDFYDSAFRTAKRNKESPSTVSASIGGRCVL